MPMPEVSLWEGQKAWEQISASGGTLRGAISPDYMDIVPIDPSQSTVTNSTPCGSDTEHRYNFFSDGNTYMLTAIMEIPTSKDDSPCGSNLTATCGGASYATVDECYFAQSP